MRTDQQPIRIALFAPEGRMGQAIAAAATSKVSERESFSMGTSLAWAPGEAKHGMDRESLAFAER